MHGPLNVESSYDYKYWVRTPDAETATLKSQKETEDES
jgi:hypothetical protein